MFMPFIFNIGIEETSEAYILIRLVVSFVLYAFNAIGIYAMSKKRGYQKPWIAFIPAVNGYILGAIVDNISRCYGKKTCYRIILLWLEVACAIIVISARLIVLNPSAMNVVSNIHYDAVGLLIIWLSLLCVAVIGTSAIFTYICDYKLFEDYDKKNSALYLVLSILFRIEPFFIFAIRNNPSMSLYYANRGMIPPQYMPSPPMPNSWQYYQPMNGRYQQPIQYQQPVQGQYQPPQYQTQNQPMPTPVSSQQETTKNEENPPFV